MLVLNFKHALKRVKELFIVSSILGLSNAFRAEKFYLKIIWLVVFVAASILSMTSIVDNIFEYLNYDVVTKIDLIDEIKVDYPAITFYNLNDPKANFSLTDIMIDCYFGNEQCNETDFDTLVDNNGYISYRLKPREAYFAGKLFGLDLILFNKKGKTLNERRTNGYEVIIHNYSLDPSFYSGFSNDAITVSPGLATSLIINRVYSYKLDKPYNNCLKKVSLNDSDKNDLLEFILKNTSYLYRQRDCLDYCISLEMIKYYKVSVTLDNPFNVINTLIRRFNISSVYLSNLYISIIKGKQHELCLKKCPLECDSIKYEITSMVSKFPNEDYANVLMNNTKVKSFFPFNYTISLNDLEKCLIYLKVYYRDLKYTKITQLPKLTLFEFVSNLGGILGLFIGISFLSFVEIFEIFIEFLIILCNFKH